jgi:hypothetical protein
MEPCRFIVEAKVLSDHTKIPPLLPLSCTDSFIIDPGDVPLMVRVYGDMDQGIVEQIDREAAKEGISRAKWVEAALLYYLHRPAPGADQKPDQTSTAFQAVITAKEELIKAKDSEIAFLRAEYHRITQQNETLMFRALPAPGKTSFWSRIFKKEPENP